MSSRREFLALLGASAFAAPLARAQIRPASRPFRIGLFTALEGPFLNSMHEAMSAAGWRQGRDYVFVQSGAGYVQPTQSEAARLVVQKIDLILVGTTAHALAAHRVTSDIPIVMWASGYPVEAGVAVSLARPGKNVTGMTTYAGTGIWGKLLELLRESKPTIERIGVAWGYVPPAFPRAEIEPCYRELRQAAHALRVGLHIEEIGSPEGMSAGLEAIEARKPNALVIGAGAFYLERHRAMQFAVSKRIPTAVDWRWPPTGDFHPLLVYGPPFDVLMRQAATYVVRILEGGVKAGDLPIQQPSKLELVVNLKSAKAIGLTIPQTLLLRADDVIE